jgi:uncharacterized protein (TIGR02117 family)
MPKGEAHEILLVKGPIHYDFLLPLTAETRAQFSGISSNHPVLNDPNARWILVGWGARTFYTTVGGYRDLSLKAVWRGIFGDASVMRVDVLGPLPANLPARHLLLDNTQYAAMLKAITDSFVDTTPIDHSGFSSSDAFYPAKGRFNLTRTCNVWVGRMIRASGRRFGSWTPIPASLTLSHRLYGP